MNAMSKRVIEVEALRQVAFPGFPIYGSECQAVATDPREDFAWDCNRHPGHEGPHMSTFEYDGEGTIIGFAWTENDAAGETNDERIRREREAVREGDATMVCDECPNERDVQNYYDHHSDVEVDLCPSCYHHAVRSGAELG